MISELLFISLLAYNVSIQTLSADNYHYAGDYHFVCQCSDGSWGGKFGTGTINNYAGDDAPETDNTIWYQNNSYYVNSDILYFAYSGN